MPSVEAYDANLHRRLEELRQGDPAYQLHERAIIDALIFSADLHRDATPQSLLDCGCGLGFMTARLNALGWKAIGIDISEQALALARKEHPSVSFYAEPADTFAEKMAERSIERFNHAVLNMVVHSVDDDVVRTILRGVRRCLKPEASLLLVVPTQEWLVQKLVEFAQDVGMKRGPGIAWIASKLQSQKVELPVKIRGGEYYPESITIYNRSEEDYGDLLMECGLGVPWEKYDGETNELMYSTKISHIDMFDYISSAELIQRDRELMMSFAV
ncbi:class I SAM-dependent methyltransferase [Candidatus Woesebacteria bacterium]|nr:class I SAM-dependent methyltransferase [Candidatus Woesebacteria bacterium]